MNRNTLLALGLEALVIGGVAAEASRAPQPPSGRRPPVPSTARHAFAAKNTVTIRSAPRANAPAEGTFGLGSGFLVGDPVLDFYPIVREWVNEDGSRTSRTLAWIAASDVTFTDPLVTPVTLGASGASLLGTLGAPLTLEAFGSSPRPLVLGDKPALGRSDAGECDHFVKFAWAAGVNDFKDLLHRVWETTDRMIADCPSLSVANKEQWASELAAWRRFYATKADFWNSGNQWDTTCNWSRRLDGWRDLVAAEFKTTGCKLVGPTTVRGYEMNESVANALGNIATIVKWGALAAGGALLVTTFLPEIKAGLTTLRAARGTARRST